MELMDFLKEQGVSIELLKEVDKFIKFYDLDKNLEYRVPNPRFKYYGKSVWEKSIAAILSGNHILLSGPKATGKNVLAENLALLFKRPLWTISLNINTDVGALIGSDTFKNNEVVLKKGPVYEAAEYGGFGIFDEINMAKNEALSVVHSALDYRRIIDVPGYDRLNLHEATRFIATMNYGYIGTRDLNEALVSRFLVIDMPTITQEDLISILIEKTNLKIEYTQRFAKFFLDLQQKSLNSEISSKPIDLRGLISAISLMEYGLSINEAIEMGMSHKSFDVYETEIVEDTLKTLFEKNLKSEELFK
ncbi:AAA family ATPase [Anaerosphaera multitolerans]|uniref:MoxR family ATPase n=1 Tax=Anaerosphaera multitolerans TaxID=2487351 RepID=A0A437S4V2_9FIRM|nr:MoxR family ATPase [Anaerosphaera multitolerans]RVU53996.1 MoxR family ATPase [Anaerosphaera multitolerans]